MPWMESPIPSGLYCSHIRASSFGSSPRSSPPRSPLWRDKLFMYSLQTDKSWRTVMSIWWTRNGQQHRKARSICTVTWYSARGCCLLQDSLLRSASHDSVSLTGYLDCFGKRTGTPVAVSRRNRFGHSASQHTLLHRERQSKRKDHFAPVGHTHTHTKKFAPHSFLREWGLKVCI